MKKKWITKAEISKILKTYSIRGDEFEPVGSTGYFYQSKFVKGYTISISKEKYEALDSYHETGRIIVSHTQYNGRKTYNDIWERDQDGRMQFRFRNLWNQPFSDAECIKELEDKYHSILIVAKGMQDKLREMSKESDSNSLSSSSQIEQLQTENERLKQELASYTRHNARGAGRKPSKERLSAINQVKAMIESGCSDRDIMDRLGISRATFYRYKKNLKN